MAKLDEARIRTLLAKEKYKEAGKLLNDFVTEEKENDSAWYLLGILAMKLGNHELAHEYFEKALMINKKVEYLMFDGLAYLETLDVEEAIDRFSEYLKTDGKNVEVNFYLAVCYMLKGDPRSSKHIRTAYSIDKEKTRGMLRSFFAEVIENNPSFDRDIKEQIRKRLS